MAYQCVLKLYVEIGGIAASISTPQSSQVGITLAQSKLEQTLAHVEPMLSLLLGDEPLVLDEPFEVYLTCCVLEASGDVRAASLLQRAEQRLQECAEHIMDDAQRWLFLENAAVHHAILTPAHTTVTPVAVR
jgi:hypothetical protein